MMKVDELSTTIRVTSILFVRGVTLEKSKLIQNSSFNKNNDIVPVPAQRHQSCYANDNNNNDIFTLFVL